MTNNELSLSNLPLDTPTGITFSDNNTVTTSSDTHSIIPSTTMYSVFRKNFHIPNNKNFNALYDLKYNKTESAFKSIEIIKNYFSEMNYSLQNDQMLHDYLHYIIVDILKLENIPFISENEIREDELLLKLFKDFAPDLIIKPSKKKPIIIDIYNGVNLEKKQRKINHYMSLGTFFDNEKITNVTINSLSEVFQVLYLKLILNISMNSIKSFLLNILIGLVVLILVKFYIMISQIFLLKISNCLIYRKNLIIKEILILKNFFIQVL